MIMVGIVLGSGIFLTTGIMAESLPSASMILLVWIIGGLLTLAGALTYAELGAALPRGRRDAAPSPRALGGAEPVISPRD